MNTMPEQNYENHSARTPVFAGVMLVLLASVIGAGVNLFESLGDHERLYSAALIFVLTICIFLIGGLARRFATKVQDRSIRAEENLRHYALTGKLLDPRLEPLQIVALRFASDDQFPDLAREAAEKTMKPDEIKRAVKTWRTDLYRV